MFGVVTGVLSFIEPPLIEQGEGVMIAGMPGKISSAGRFSDEKTEQVEVEPPARLQVGSVKTEVAEAANLKRPVERDAADVVFSCHGKLSYDLS
jgi:hypothetical protein